MSISSAIFLGAIGFAGSSSPPDSGSAELFWPSDEHVFMMEVLEAHISRAYPTLSWPRSKSEICTVNGIVGDSASKSTVTFSHLLHDFCRERDRRRPIGVKIEVGSYALGKIAPLGLPFESFGGTWGSTRTDPELGRAWTRLPPAVNLELRHGFSPRAFIYFRMGLRRDLSAWRRDDLALNLPLSSDEVDLNEPSLGYFHWEGDFLATTVGRFPIHWSPNRDFGLMLSDAVPYHNAVQSVLKMPRLRYRFLVSSLNPWLEGTPTGNPSGTDFPEGSEEWRQRHYPVLPGSENAHKRVYDQPIKTLIAHRLETWAGPVSLGITETNVVGGKTPDLKDMNPFGVFHNDFREGFSNNNVSVDAAWKLPLGFTLAGEFFMDDIEWSDTEGNGTTPSLLGYMGALRHSFSARGWAVSQSLHAVRTDPFLYGFLQPLNTYSSRHVLTSNDQRPGDARFVDKYVIDYPIGYLRGADAYDFWYRVDGVRGRALRISATAALLAKGEAGAGTPFEQYFISHGSSPTGVAERELRVSASGEWRWKHGLSLLGGAEFRKVDNQDHVSGEDRLLLHFSAGVSWSLRP